MGISKRYLTKSRFQLSLSCPTKQYYSDKPEYANQSFEDPFMESLAEGGFQVSALARCYFPGGVEIETSDDESALQQTNALLTRDEVVIYEAAFRTENLFIRTDILLKHGQDVELIEVKAKLVDFVDELGFLSQSGTISSKWSEYVYDVAFQKYVLTSAFPRFNVKAYLMMADKNALCPTDGLNQKFRITRRNNGKKVVITGNVTTEDLSVPILRRISVDHCCDLVYRSKLGSETDSMSFQDYVDFLSDCYAKDSKIKPVPSTECKYCVFKATDEELEAGLKSGFRECWQESLGWNEDDFKEPTILALWNYRKKSKMFEEGRVKLKEVTEDDIKPKKDGKPGLSCPERQWLQVEKVVNHDTSYWFDAVGVSTEMKRWVFPLHFIDFETSRVAIPFSKGRHPYEGIAFQYSHHTVYQDGRVAHKSQFINTIPGKFPNYDFIRQLKCDLEQDSGSIFRYAAHENTFLNHIYTQLREDGDEILDREALCRFIRSITFSARDSEETWVGERVMIDMLELVKRFYYDPSTGGSNSIKFVLPAMLNRSVFLQEKYSKPIYGAVGGIPSLNYRDWTWIVWEDGVVLDPYTLLPKMFQDMTEQESEMLSESDELKSGGAAMTAYARMQFEEMSDFERGEIEKALLKYCELDTMAMVMIFEGWKYGIFGTGDCPLYQK